MLPDDFGAVAAKPWPLARIRHSHEPFRFPKLLPGACGLVNPLLGRRFVISRSVVRPHSPAPVILTQVFALARQFTTVAVRPPPWLPTFGKGG